MRVLNESIATSSTRAPDLEALAAEKGPELVRLARALMRDPHQAEDLVQDVLARCVLKWSRIAQVDDPAAYLKRMVVNAVTSWSRRPSRRETASDPVELSDLTAAGLITPDLVAAHAERERCLALLRDLPARQRIALVLRIYEQRSDDEIADLLNCTPGTVRSNAHRGLATLRRRLEEERRGRS